MLYIATQCFIAKTWPFSPLCSPEQKQSSHTISIFFADDILIFFLVSGLLVQGCKGGNEWDCKEFFLRGGITWLYEKHRKAHKKECKVLKGRFTFLKNVSLLNSQTPVTVWDDSKVKGVIGGRNPLHFTLCFSNCCPDHTVCLVSWKNVSGEWSQLIFYMGMCF